MRRSLLLAGVGLALTSSLAFASPESLLPNLYADPAPAPSPTPAPAPVATQAPSQGAVAPVQPGSTSTPVIQAIPGLDGGATVETGPLVALPEGFPSLEKIEAMSPEELDELLGLKPKYDIPPSARRDLRWIGLLSRAEGGLPLRSLAGQPASLVRAAIEGTKRPLVSRWGHILLRRALVSRLDAPAGMDPVDFAAMRASLLMRIGEANAARALVQDVDSSHYNLKLTNAAFDSYVATGDLLGMCPVARLQPSLRDDPEWEMTQLICASYAGDESRAGRELSRALSRGMAPPIDVLLAQRFAGSAGEGRRAVNIEWDDVDELTPWRYSLATSLGVEIPENLWNEGGYFRWAAVSPAVSLSQRAQSSRDAAEAGILSSSALVDLYGQVYAVPEIDGEPAEKSRQLRNAYVARTPADRLEAIKQLWGEDGRYGDLVLSAYAAARLPVNEQFEPDAARLIASMLAAGLDRNAMRWGPQVGEGTQAWALLALAQPQRSSPVSGGALDTYLDNDGSSDSRKSRFLVAGLAGLDRIDSGDVSSLSDRLGIDLDRQSAWSRMIDRAAQVENPTLVALLAGLGMQGDGWDKMTARHLYHIVRALNRVGLQAEARMIAAEAVARA